MSGKLPDEQTLQIAVDRLQDEFFDKSVQQIEEVLKKADGNIVKAAILLQTSKNKMKDTKPVLKDLFPEANDEHIAMALEYARL